MSRKQWLALLQGTVVVTDDAGNTIFSHSVEAGDIWRMCQTKDAAIKVTQSNKDEIIYYTFRVLVISQC